MSNTTRILGWFRAATARASCSKRCRRSVSRAKDSGRIFKATSRPNRVSRARYTSPMPPAPSGATISYGPTLVPEVRAIRTAYYSREHAALTLTCNGLQLFMIRCARHGCQRIVGRELPDCRHNRLISAHFQGVRSLLCFRLRSWQVSAGQRPNELRFSLSHFPPRRTSPKATGPETATRSS